MLFCMVHSEVNAEEEGGVANVRDLLTNCTYLEDAEVQVCGIRIYGSPWFVEIHFFFFVLYLCTDGSNVYYRQPEFCDWAFNLPRGAACLAKWNMIPDHTDVLMTHGPPIGLLLIFLEGIIFKQEDELC